MKKKTTPSITKGDFDRAVKQPFSGSTCLVAQFMLRNGLEICSDGSALFFAIDHKIRHKTTWIFDKHFRMPGDESKPELQALRASLPIKVKI